MHADKQLLTDLREVAKLLADAARTLTRIIDRLEAEDHPQTIQAEDHPQTIQNAIRCLDAKWGDRDSFTVPEAGEILGISRWAAYEAAKTNQLPVIRIGKRCIVPRRALEKMLNGENTRSYP